ncbi:MAG: hypothetical protein JSR97_03455 [Verrucomicrobia bacterium]|nr:hypothetical protein [Verrucomicrobiota bacterium]
MSLAVNIPLYAMRPSVRIYEPEELDIQVSQSPDGTLCISVDSKLTEEFLNETAFCGLILRYAQTRDSDLEQALALLLELKAFIELHAEYKALLTFDLPHEEAGLRVLIQEKQQQQAAALEASKVSAQNPQPSCCPFCFGMHRFLKA